MERREAFEQSSGGEVIGISEGVQVVFHFFEGGVAFGIEGVCFDSAVVAFDHAIGPGVAGLSEFVFNAKLGADGIEGMCLV